MRVIGSLVGWFVCVLRGHFVHCFGLAGLAFLQTLLLLFTENRVIFDFSSNQREFYVSNFPLSVFAYQMPP